MRSTVLLLLHLHCPGLLSGARYRLPKLPREARPLARSSDSYEAVAATGVGSFAKGAAAAAALPLGPKPCAA
jgi:hypothetical protein